MVAAIPQGMGGFSVTDSGDEGRETKCDGQGSEVYD